MSSYYDEDEDYSEHEEEHSDDEEQTHDDDDDDEFSDKEQEEEGENEQQHSSYTNIKRGGADELEDSDDDNDDETQFKKFNNDIRNSILTQTHTELFQESFPEIQAKCNVIRDENGIILDPYHKTIPILTKYEKTKILGIRSKQLTHGSKPFIQIEDHIIDPLLIAEQELEQGVIPFIVVRPLPNGQKEYWRLKDLEQVHY